ncbi:hypothetical protein BIY26_01330 [Brenneria goodwinii]|uniref:Lipoprotein n=1 Tax=Brenneria goodwinii TaxID=1109412 RepID=A0A0G4K1J9_9GAMM|nr:hypothetical protein [Brenneria goodwinii]ATA24131.1 hypothetical protein AWC36_08405 [Brenneria goodwinii]MCG8155275.1 hypothetical protein [Brenneria goodwinii]MCG8159519.1 hypothetical protein [Brenneria goodwinii]MCG8164312.1 hypothetical protein [Brenneria goodwinii]MCG8169122.1 hypothetical protein [Brenneria goodwinii]
MYKKLALAFSTLFVPLFLTGCLDETPPENVLNSKIILRSGIDDGGGFTVKQVIESIHYLQKYGDTNVRVRGWEKGIDRYTYIYTYESGGIRHTVVSDFYPQGDYTFFRNAGNPSFLAARQDLMGYASVYDQITMRSAQEK